MSLQYKFFVIPIRGIQEAESEINRFLRSVRVINIRQEFVAHKENSFWSMAVEYLSEDVGKSASESDVKRKSKIDYREVLSPEDFAVYAKLRQWRKEIAGEEAVPVYTIFTNEQLAKIAEKRVITKARLQEINGVGDSRVKKYGEAVITIVAQESQVNEEKTEG